MPVVTFFATIWTNPEPTILFLFYCIQKVFANLYKFIKKLIKIDLVLRNRSCAIKSCSVTKQQFGTSQIIRSTMNGIPKHAPQNLKMHSAN